MRLAARDLCTVQVQERIEPTSKRLDAPEQYGKPADKQAMVAPLQNKLQAELYGERSLQMQQMIATWQVGLGARVTYKDEPYKVISKNGYGEHTEYVLERID